MKKMLIMLAMVVGISVMGQTNVNKPVFIRGNMNIAYDTKVKVDSSGKPLKGVKDTYTLNVNVCNSVVFRGNITDTPIIKEGYISQSITQSRKLDYNLVCDIINPNNTNQIKQNVGKIIGSVPVSEEGVYDYKNGNLAISVLPLGLAPGFDSRFDGAGYGKPLIRPPNYLETLKRDIVNITKTSNGKTVTIQLKKWDKFEMKNVILASGPVQSYSRVTVNGLMIFEYTKNCWFFKDFNLNYTVNNQVINDNVTGTIIYSEELNKYTFDVRFNENVNENAVFAQAQDESAFFQIDENLSALVGEMSYVDVKNKDKETVSSKVDINLTGNKINKYQAMAMCKVLVFLAISPMNSD